MPFLTSLLASCRRTVRVGTGTWVRAQWWDTGKQDGETEMHLEGECPSGRAAEFQPGGHSPCALVIDVSVGKDSGDS